MKALHVLGSIGKRLAPRYFEHDTVVILAACLLITLTAVIAYDVTRPLVSRPASPEVAVGSHSSRLVVASPGQPGGAAVSPPTDSAKASTAPVVGKPIEGQGSQTSAGSPTPEPPASSSSAAAPRDAAPVNLPAAPSTSDDCVKDNNSAVSDTLDTITMGLGVLVPLIGQSSDCR